MRKHRALLRTAVLFVAIIQLVAFLPMSAILPVRAADKTVTSTGTREEYLARAREFFSKKFSKLTENDADPNEVVRVMVELDGGAAATTEDDPEYTDELRETESDLLDAQAAIIRKVEKLTGNKAINRTAYLFNGFSIEMKRSQIREVEGIDGVKSVSQVTVYEQDMASAVDMTSAFDMWQQENGGYTGEGIVIAIVDSGVNYTHPDMQFPEDADVELKFPDAEEMQALIDEVLGYGKYYTPKVPFGYSYGGKADGDVNNNSVDHGLHVSGIAAGTGENLVTGVAPNAQLFAMQVFTDNGSAYTDDIIKAVEDSVKLGADIINLSLGNNPGFYNDVNYLERALEYAEEKGVLCCVAAGNDGLSSSFLGGTTNDWGITDTGSASAPCTYPGALSVASVDNDFMPVNIMDIYVDGNTVVENYPAWDFATWYDSDWTSLSGIRVIDCGIGDSSDFAAAEEYYGDYIALIERGTLNFEVKIMNAYESGALGVIIYNQEDTTNPNGVPTNVSAGNFYDYYTIPAIAVGRDVGLAILDAADAGLEVSYSGMNVAYTSAEGGMSSFSSWGPTPTLDIKPEISAPGGNIISISFGDSYVPMSGTSMATPYVSGASALALQALKEAVKNGELVLGDALSLSSYLKLALMNTADPIMNGDAIVPVRQQGAGMVDPLGAGSARVVATYNGLASVALKEIGERTQFTVTLTNYGNEDAKYSIPTYVPTYTDYTDPNTAEYYDVKADAVVTFDKNEVTVPAGGSVDVVCTLAVGSGAIEDHYIEAFLRFEGDIDLSLPLLAFYGDWSDVDRIVDLPAWDEDNILSNYYRMMNDIYYEQLGYDILQNVLATMPFGTIKMENMGETMVGGQYLGVFFRDELYDPQVEHMAFSPNGDGYFDGVQPYVGLLRSAESITVDILDADKNVIRRINSREYVSKTLAYDIISSGVPYTALSPVLEGEGVWDGTVYDQKTGKFVPVPEGQYYISIKATMPGSDKVEETLMPVKLDTTGPKIEITDVTYYESEGVVCVEYTADDSCGVVDDAIVFINGYYAELVPSYDEDSGKYSVYMPADTYFPGEVNEIAVSAMDYAWNEEIGFYYTDVDELGIPVIFTNISNDESEPAIISEAVYGTATGADGSKIFTDIKAVIRGLADKSVAKITINGTEAEIFGNGTFSVYVPMEIGFSELVITAEDVSGNVILNSKRTAIIDLYTPTVVGYVTDEELSGAWGEDNVYCSIVDGLTGGYTFATKYDFGDLVPVAVNVSDEALADLKITWFEGELGADLLDNTGDYNTLLNYLFEYNGDGREFALPEDLNEEARSISLSNGDFTLGADGSYCFKVPFFTQVVTDYDYETGESSVYEYATQVAIVEATDVVGNASVFFIMLEGGELAENSYNAFGDVDIRDEETDMSGGLNFTEFGPVDADWYVNFMPLTLFGWATVDPELVDEDGTLTLWGVLPEDTDFDQYLGITCGSGELIEPETNEDGQRVVKFDVKLEPGTNIVYYSLMIDEWGEIIPITWRLTLYYLPEGTETAISFEDDKIADGAVIYTNSDVFNVSGDIFTLVGNLEFMINGDMITFMTSSGNDVTGRGDKSHFNYPVTLTEGENVVTVQLYDDVGTVTEMSFTVILDKKAPATPSISADENGSVTITNEEKEESVTLYYSLDGENWIAYTGTFAMEKDGTVRAKAVDAAGNESEIASLVVTLPSPADPTIKADKDGNVTITGGEGDVLYYSLDGKEWIKYEGSFKMSEGGKVYAKAVSANGKESAVVTEDVTVTPPTPPTPDEPVTPPPTGDDFGPMNFIMITLSLMAIAWVIVDMKRSNARVQK